MLLFTKDLQLHSTLYDQFGDIVAKAETIFLPNLYLNGAIGQVLHEFEW
jgi:hypothetical protein